MGTNRLPNLKHKDQETMRRHAIPAWVAYIGSAVWMVLAALVVVYLNAVVSQADPALHGQALVEALRAGGYHIYFRHAATEWSQSDQVVKAGDWTSCEPDKMRQLADRGRHMARAIGEAIRALDIPVSRVFASPYCRTVETASLLRLGDVSTTTDIMNTRVAAYFGGTEAIAARARQRLSTPPLAGTNTVLVAHGNVLRAATGVYPQEAEAIVFRPQDQGRYTVVARLSLSAWEDLVAEQRGR
jgi:broad specificity phosphatase PhoE